MLNTYLQGFGIGLGLILAIGAQNAFVLKQGLKKQHVFWLCLVCALSDSMLILFGVLGFSKLILLYPNLVVIAKYLGALFLLFYGAQHFYQAFKVQQCLQLSENQETKLLPMIMICLALTWLNPHVYLDTVVLIGTVSTQFPTTQIYFALGAMTASWIFFYSLGYGARLLLPLFQQTRSWQILDFLIACMMWGIAISLLLS
ncbi:LysE/ArgO family amino acid transporter [Acinetobacter sp. ANC 3832]|uniref:LysE/ArgO family amino acid transporter n=1 Tax=Acinetobacter sp. ANC 3832 TaxID=1977874 RepID=UPI000A34E7AC|nr:LysE/ArgO family amino acid transporter [Acinetobacter sp. ANC 3832]OTG95036.1 amino acid transporter [Acinetobacter sp. ANC 3832]